MSACRYWAMSVACLMLSACQQPPTSAERVRPVSVTTVEQVTASSEQSYAGVVRPRIESSLGFRIGGKLVERHAEVGQLVQAGQVLMRLDPVDQALSERSLRSEVDAAKASRDQAKAELERFRDLIGRRLVSQSEFDLRQSTYDAAQARYEQARTRLAESARQSDYTELRADHTGVITAVQAEVGQVLSAGQTVLSVARLDEKEVQINVPETRIAQFHPGQSVSVRLWALPQQTYVAKVREVAPMADSVTRTYSVKVSLADADAQVQLGMTANVLVQFAEPAHLRVPLTALAEQHGQAVVWTVDAQQTLQARPVTVHAYQNDWALLSDGVAAGTRIVALGVHKLHAGQVVRPEELLQ